MINHVSHVSKKDIKEAFRYALNPTILAIVIIALIFSKFLEFSNVGNELLDLLKGLGIYYFTITSFLITCS